MTTAASAFLDPLEPAQRMRWDQPDLPAILTAAFDTARAAWPAIEVGATGFAAHLGRAVAGQEDLRPDALASLCLGDLYLACACSLGADGAVAAFRRNFFGDVEAALRHLNLPTDAVEEIEQEILEEVLTTRDGAAPIAGYSGRGALRRWVRSIAVRMAAKRYRGEQRDARARSELQEILPALDDDAELEHFKSQYAPQYKAALGEALQELSVRERNVLRQYFIDGLSVDQLGRLYGVHRSTAARWVTRAREHAYTKTMERLRDSLGMSESEVADVGRIVRSQLDLSFGRLLG